MQVERFPIKNWARDDRPREKLLTKSAAALSDAELLAILIKDGSREKNAVELARDILRMGSNDLNSLGRLSVTDLMRVKGIGMAKAVIIAAALELGRRRQAGSAFEKTLVRSSRDVAGYLQPLLRDLRHEIFGVVLLNRGNYIRHFEIISQGGITATVADPRIILKKALEQDATGLILCHNHPSGNLQPSRADEELTAKIKGAALLFDIRLLDHIIVGENGYFSFADQGIL